MVWREDSPDPGPRGDIGRVVKGSLFMLGVALLASLLNGGGLLEMLAILVVVMGPAALFVLATRLPDRLLGAALAVTLAGSLLPLVLPPGAMGSGPITFATLGERKAVLAYLGVLVVFLGLALEGVRRLLRWEASRRSD